MAKRADWADWLDKWAEHPSAHAGENPAVNIEILALLNYSIFLKLAVFLQ